MRSTWLFALSLLGIGASVLASADEPAKPGVHFEGTNVLFADVQARAKESGKPILIDFFTDWCGWCKRLESDTFADAAVGERTKSLLAVRYDADVGEGKTLAERYRAEGFPTLVVVDAEGTEIDRIVGYLAPIAFVQEISRILEDKGTLRSLRTAHLAAPEAAAPALRYAERLAQSEPKAARELLSKVAAAHADKDPAVESEALVLGGALAAESGHVEEATTLYKRVLERFPTQPSAPRAAVALARVSLASNKASRGLATVERFRAAIEGDPVCLRALPELEVALHLAAAGDALVRQAELAGDDADALNEAAWAAFVRNLRLPEAVGWARRAVEKTGREDAAILDTLANLLFASSEVEEAVRVEEEAVAKAKDDDLRAELREVLAKFRAVLATRQEGAAKPAAGREEPAPPKDRGPAPKDPGEKSCGR